MDDYSPEKAGVGGSTPSLATIFNHLQILSLPWSHYGHKKNLQFHGCATSLYGLSC